MQWIIIVTERLVVHLVLQVRHILTVVLRRCVTNKRLQPLQQLRLEGLLLRRVGVVENVAPGIEVGPEWGRRKTGSYSAILDQSLRIQAEGLQNRTVIQGNGIGVVPTECTDVRLSLLLLLLLCELNTVLRISDGNCSGSPESSERFSVEERTLTDN